MSIPDYNTVVPYPHMRERCPTLPPDYKKPGKKNNQRKKKQRKERK